jgi:hypothetical protein
VQIAEKFLPDQQENSLNVPKYATILLADAALEQEGVFVDCSGFPFRLSVQAFRSGFPFRLFVQAFRSGFSFRLFVQAFRSGLC